MARKKTGNGNGKRKRQSPSVERQIALALVRVIECVVQAEILGQELKNGDSSPQYEQAQIDRKQSIDEARKILEVNGYAELESIASRVAALENQLTAAISMRDGKAVARLGAELERAKTGRPPIASPKKTRVGKPASTTQQSLPTDESKQRAGASIQPDPPAATSNV